MKTPRKTRLLAVYVDPDLYRAYKEVMEERKLTVSFDRTPAREALEYLRTALSESVVPDPGFASRVVAAARAETERAARADRGAPARAARRSWRLLNPALATVTTFTALVMASGGAAVQPGVALLLSLAAGTAVLVWEGRRPEPGVARAA